MIRRQLRWNMEINTGEQERMRYRYVFAIINEKREIERISKRIFEQLAPVDLLNPICDYSDKGWNGIHCRVFALSSEVGRIEHPKLIYDSPDYFKQDRDLAEKTEIELIPWLERLSP